MGRRGTSKNFEVLQTFDWVMYHSYFAIYVVSLTMTSSQYTIYNIPSAGFDTENAQGQRLTETHHQNIYKCNILQDMIVQAK